MIRVVLALAVATAILGLALPASEYAGVTHSDSQVAAELGRIDRAARTLAARSVGAPYGVTGRRTMTLSLPASTWARPGLAELSIPGPDGPRRLTWRVEGGTEHSRRLPARLTGPPGGLSLRDGGPQRVVLRLRDGQVEIRRLKFIREGEGNGRHERSPGLVAAGARGWALWLRGGGR